MKVSDFGLIWRPLRQYLQIMNFFEKASFVTLLPSQSPNFMPKIKKKKKYGAVSEKTTLPTNHSTNQPTNQPNIKVSDLGLIWRPFREYL